MNAITILNTGIRQDANGLFSLNDLHKAAGGTAKHQPAFFVRLETTQALVAEIHSTDSQSASSADSRSLKTINGGPNRGTYACRELVIAYAAWISAEFHLKVIRVFLATQAPAKKALPRHKPAYMLEPWFVVMEMHAGQMMHRALARALGIHECTLSKVLRGTGKYGDGTVATTRIEERVLRTFCHARRVRRAPLPRQLNLI